MKISGFTITRNARKYNYPLIESIHSILPLCDEFIVNVGDSEDDTLDLVRSIQSDKIRIIENTWSKDQKPDVLSHQTNLALKECQGDWAFYLQSDEVIHQEDLGRLKRLMQKYHHQSEVDAFKFRWMHFYGTYNRYRVDYGWFQKQDRIIRNNGEIESTKDAWGFKRVDDKPLKSIKTGCLLYHYGWVQPPDIMHDRRENAQYLWDEHLTAEEKHNSEYQFGDLKQFPYYFGTHPSSMEKRVAEHQSTQIEREKIKKQMWWNPFLYVCPRYKTGRRVKEKLS